MDPIFAAIGGAAATILAAKLAPDSFGRLLAQFLFAGQERETTAVSTMSNALEKALDTLGDRLSDAMNGWRESTTNFARLSEQHTGFQTDIGNQYQYLRGRAEKNADTLDAMENRIVQEVEEMKNNFSMLVSVLSRDEKVDDGPA